MVDSLRRGKVAQAGGKSQVAEDWRSVSRFSANRPGFESRLRYQLAALALNGKRRLPHPILSLGAEPDGFFLRLEHSRKVLEEQLLPQCVHCSRRKTDCDPCSDALRLPSALNNDTKSSGVDVTDIGTTHHDSLTALGTDGPEGLAQLIRFVAAQEVGRRAQDDDPIQPLDLSCLHAGLRLWSIGTRSPAGDARGPAGP